MVNFHVLDTGRVSAPLSLPPQLSFVFAEFPMVFVLNNYLNNNEHILQSVKTCGKDTYHFTSVDSNVGK